MPPKKGRKPVATKAKPEVGALLDAIRPQLEPIAVALRRALHQHERLGSSSPNVSALVEAEQALQLIQQAVDAATPQEEPEEPPFVPQVSRK
jgi:hypothetical protein